MEETTISDGAAVIDDVTEAERSSLDLDAQSRMVAVYGMKGQIRIAGASILLSGLGGAGAEIAKNLVLCGVRKCTIHDDTIATVFDRNTNFYIPSSAKASEDGSYKKSRSALTIDGLRKQNPSVDVSVIQGDLLADLSMLGSFSVVIVNDMSIRNQIAVNQYCRSKNIHFVASQVRGVFASTFVDFGDHFITRDKDGNQLKEVMIHDISQENPAMVTTVITAGKGLKGEHERHELEDGDRVMFRGACAALSDKNFCVKVETPYKFSIDIDGSSLPKYEGGVTAVQIKVAKKIPFQTLEARLLDPVLQPFDPCARKKDTLLHRAMLALDRFAEESGALPKPWDKVDASKVLAIVSSSNAQHETEAAAKQTALDVVKAEAEALGEDGQPDEELQARLTAAQTAADVAAARVVTDLDAQAKTVELLAFTARGCLPPLCAVMGGIVAQEALKGVMEKYTPVNQWFYLSSEDVVPDNIEADQQATDWSALHQASAQQICVGNVLCQQLTKMQLLVVGSGAIGCELLKNLAMLNACTHASGNIVVTDPDTIERSNLNRQFLFSTKDVGELKSITAAAAIKRMRSHVNVQAMSEKVGADSETIFSDSFWNGLDCTLNALDNVKARGYTDARSVRASKPLIDSGTTGTKGHVQVVIPKLTETWGAQKDPPPEGIPVCTLKDSPSDISHTIAWACELLKDYYCEGGQDGKSPSRVNDVIAGIRQHKTEVLQTDVELLKHMEELMAHIPKSPEDCLTFGVKLFQKLYDYRIRDLLVRHPLDSMEKYKDSDGNDATKLFWSLPRRPPTPFKFSAADPLHLYFVMCTARLHAHLFKLKFDVTDEQAAIAIATIEVKDEYKAETDTNSSPSELIRNLARKYSMKPLTISDFEKDDDSNGHIAFITAASNLRATQYGIPTADFFKTKLTAGKIIPAIATTTSAVSGLVCIELMKIVQSKTDLTHFNNAFLNLALPVFYQSDPMAPLTHELCGNEFTDWDIWTISRGPDVQLQQVLQWLERKMTGCNVTSLIRRDTQDIVYQGGPLFKGLNSWKLTKSLVSLVHDDEGSNSEHVDLIATFEDADKVPVEQATPIVRVYFYGGYGTPVLYGNPVSMRTLPVLCVLLERNINFKLENLDTLNEGLRHLNPTLSTPTFYDGEIGMFGTSTVLRYIATKHGLEKWYPSDTTERGMCELALDSANQMELVDLTQPHEAVQQRLQPCVGLISHLLKQFGGPLIGGNEPNLGDIALGLPLYLMRLSLPTLETWTEVVSTYLDTLQERLMRWDEYMAWPEIQCRGYKLSVKHGAAVDGIWTLQLKPTAVVKELLNELSELSGIAVEEQRVGILLLPNWQSNKVDLLGGPNSRFQHGEKDLLRMRLVDVGIISTSTLVVSKVGETSLLDQESVPAAPPQLLRSYSNQMRAAIAAGEISQVVQVDMRKMGHSMWDESDKAKRDLTLIQSDVQMLIQALQVSSEGTIFIAQDQRKLYYLKALITGPVGSIYENGMFEFDIKIPAEYPLKPPKVKLVTTRQGQVRFNANLYANGKVCLSLLGTWRGPGWNPKATKERPRSSLLQVVQSIQLNIMVGEPVSGAPWFNEPGYVEKWTTGTPSVEAMTPEGKATSAEYDREIRRCTMQVAMLEMIQNPPPTFADAIRSHFRAKADEIIKQAHTWLNDETKCVLTDALLKKAQVAHTQKQLELVIAGAISEETKQTELGNESDAAALNKLVESLKSQMASALKGQETAQTQRANLIQKRFELFRDLDILKRVMNDDLTEIFKMPPAPKPVPVMPGQPPKVDISDKARIAAGKPTVGSLVQELMKITQCPWRTAAYYVEGAVIRGMGVQEAVQHCFAQNKKAPPAGTIIQTKQPCAVDIIKQSDSTAADPEYENNVKLMAVALMESVATVGVGPFDVDVFEGIVRFHPMSKPEKVNTGELTNQIINEHFSGGLDPAKWLMKLGNFRAKPADLQPYEREQKWLCQCGKENSVIEINCATCTRAVTRECTLVESRASPQQIKDRLNKCVAGLTEVLSQIEWFQKLGAKEQVIWQYTAASYKQVSPYQKKGSFCWKSFGPKANEKLENAYNAATSPPKPPPTAAMSPFTTAMDNAFTSTTTPTGTTTTNTAAGDNNSSKSMIEISIKLDPSSASIFSYNKKKKNTFTAKCNADLNTMTLKQKKKGETAEIASLRRIDVPAMVFALRSKAGVGDDELESVRVALQAKLTEYNVLLAAQATALIAATPSTPTCSWPICAVCTFKNTASATKCAMCGKDKPAPASTPKDTKLPQSTWDWIDVLFQAGKEVSFSGSDAVQSTGSASSGVQRAVQSQGPYIRASTTTKSICESLEKVLLNLKAGKPITASSPVKLPSSSAPLPPGPGGPFMPPSTFSTESYSYESEEEY